MRTERHCSVVPKTGRVEFSFVIICLEDVYPNGCVDTYVHFIEHAPEGERSDDCSREKALWSISLGKVLSDGVNGNFLHRPRERAIDLEGMNMGFLLARYQDLDVYVPY